MMINLSVEEWLEIAKTSGAPEYLKDEEEDAALQ